MTPHEFRLMVRAAHFESALLLFAERAWPPALFTLCLLSKESCLYVGADLLSSFVSQRVVRSQLCPKRPGCYVWKKKRLHIVLWWSVVMPTARMEFTKLSSMPLLPPLPLPPPCPLHLWMLMYPMSIIWSYVVVVVCCNSPTIHFYSWSLFFEMVFAFFLSLSLFLFLVFPLPLRPPPFFFSKG